MLPKWVTSRKFWFWVIKQKRILSPNFLGIFLIFRKVVIFFINVWYRNTYKLSRKYFNTFFKWCHQFWWVAFQKLLPQLSQNINFVVYQLQFAVISFHITKSAGHIFFHNHVGLKNIIIGYQQYSLVILRHVIHFGRSPHICPSIYQKHNDLSFFRKCNPHYVKEPPLRDSPNYHNVNHIPKHIPTTKSINLSLSPSNHPSVNLSYILHPSSIKPFIYPSMVHPSIHP